MITLKTMEWSGAFSYGPNNKIDFSEFPLLQLVGKNGHGKTSIALILEELLYNKNSKGLKKADILNRYIKDKFYTISLDFAKDGDEYRIETRRGSTQSVRLLKNSIDISAHTSTATYALIEDIIGKDHKAFSQIVFQSSASSLEFLTATDSNRKKFLIDLLNLAHYTLAGDMFKASAKTLEIEVTAKTSKFNTLNALIAKNKTVDPTIVELKDIPVLEEGVQSSLASTQYKLNNIVSNNKKIVQNNKYKEILDSIKLTSDIEFVPLDNSQELIAEKASFAKVSADAGSFIKKMNTLGDKCPTCLQEIDLVKIKDLTEENRRIKAEADASILILAESLAKLTSAKSIWKNHTDNIAQYETYYRLYDTKLPTEIDSEVDLVNTIKSLEKKISEYNKELDTVTKYNLTASAHNAKVQVISQQLIELQEEIQPLSAEIAALNSRLASLQVLIKTFSTTGLVAYKIECLIKDLESSINEYLTDLSSGRFQLSFKVNTSDKLNVVITDNGTDIDILALSGGERARVNVATLLGIRKLLQSLSSSRINLLFLDETIENLDAEGKEKLVEVLLKEQYLNTILVSHAFQHPLVEKLHIIKTNNISRIENG